MIRHILVARTQAGLCSKSVEELTLGVPIVRELRLGHGEVVSIWRQAILSFFCFDLLLVATQEKRTTRMLNVECDTFLVKISECAEQIALRSPPVGSAKVRDDV